jgi:ornithine cyclodeaminase/alanine dehydrogenase-like protein (mu-crystallin family)
MAELIPAVRDALVALSAGRVAQPVRVVVPVAEHGGFLGSMPAYAPGAEGGDAVLGAKLVAFYPGNRGVATHHAVVVLFRPETGEPLAVLGGGAITEMRTAAVSAVATDALARPDARVLGVIGAGAQARSHVEALRLVRPIDEVRVWSPRGAGALAAELTPLGARAVGSAEEAARGADVVLTATTATSPVLRGAWLSPGAHVVAVGAVRPEWRELDDDVLRAARLFVDSRDAAARESGDVIAAPGPAVEIGAVVAGDAPGRAAPDEITLFKSVGVAAADLAAAALAYRRAVARRTA